MLTYLNFLILKMREERPIKVFEMPKSTKLLICRARTTTQLSWQLISVEHSSLLPLVSPNPWGRMTFQT